MESIDGGIFLRAPRRKATRTFSLSLAPGNRGTEGTAPAPLWRFKYHDHAGEGSFSNRTHHFGTVLEIFDRRVECKTVT